MNFNPKDADQAVLPEGWYDADIGEAKDALSKKTQEPMMVVNYRVLHGDRTAFATDYITSKTLYRLKKLCAAVGLKDTFEAGSVGPNDLQGKSLRVYLVVDKDKTGQFPDKNTIKKYEARGASKQFVNPAPLTDDDLAIPEENIPF